MSMFTCAMCRNFCDSDDGCEEYGMDRLICTDCAQERDSAQDNRWEPEGNTA